MKTEKNAILYLIPSSLSPEDIHYQIPAANTAILNTLSVFIVENIRTARRFLRAAGYTANFDEVQFFVLDKHTSESQIPGFLESAIKGTDIGLLSEAGYPCIADPGQKIVRIAHQKGIQVKPLVGPSSILMALVSSGFNGQNFAFHGYLPIDSRERTRMLKHLEQEAQRKDQTQIFMETPFRNNSLLADILANCADNTYLCIACNITSSDEFIQTRRVIDWKKNMPDLNKKPGIFLIYKYR